MGNYRIGVLPGDGTGREVALEAQRILNAIEANTNHGFEQTVYGLAGTVKTSIHIRKTRGGASGDAR